MKWFLVATNILLFFFIFLSFLDCCSGNTATKKPSWLRSKVSKAKDWVKDHRPHLRSSSNSDKKDKSWARNMIDKAKSKFSSSGSSKNTGGYGSYGGTSYGGGGASSYPSSGGYSNTGRSSYPSSGGYGGNGQYSGGYSGGSYSSGGGYPSSYPTNTGGGGSYPANIPAHSGQYPIPGEAYPTKKPSFFERAKQKVKSSGVIPKAVGFVKKDLGIGVVGPKPESKILKYGRKAFEKLLGKKKVATGAGIGGAAGYAAGRASSSSRSGYDYDSAGSYQEQDQEQDQDQDQDDNRDQGQGGAIRGVLKQQISVVEEEVDEIQNELQATWNISEAGSRYKIFEEPLLKWEDAQEFCYNQGANLAVIDSDSKNQYVKELLTETMLNTTQVLWFGLHTEISTTGQQQQQQQQQQGANNQKSFSNFQAESIPGCGVIDLNGVWSISSCMLQLPFICQAIKLNGEVFIP